MTHRQKYLNRILKYRVRKQRWSNARFEWGRVNGKTARIGLSSDVVELQGKMGEQQVSSRTYNAVVIQDPWFPIPHEVSLAGPRRPPHVKITDQFYLDRRAAGYHHHRPALGFHRKRVSFLPAHVKTVRRTKRDRQITGANWHYFRQGYFPDWDVLQRRPNMTDFENGVPPATTLWPEPLGY